MDNTEYESNWAKACRARGLVSPYVTRPDEGARREGEWESAAKVVLRHSDDGGVKTQPQQ
jgi:hypothetical protein